MALGALLFACRKEEPAGPQGEPVLRIAIREPASVDPAFLSAADDFVVASNLHRMLFARDASTGKIVPDLAASHVEEQEGRVWIFKLVPDAYYSDGSAVAACDFEFAWKRTLAPATASPGADALFLLKGGREFAGGTGNQPAVSALDERTLRVELADPQPFLPEILASPRFAPLPARAFEDSAKDLMEQRQPLFSGAYVVESWARRERMVLAANPRFRTDRPAAFPRVELRFTGSEEVALAWWEAKEVEIVFNLVPMAKLPYLGAQAGGELLLLPKRSVFYFVANLAVPPLDSAAVRRALYAGLDRETLVRDVLAAGQLPARSFIPPFYEETIGFSVEACPDVEPSSATADLSEAERASAGGMELMSNSSETLKTILEFSQQSILKRVGLHLSLRLMEWSSFLELLRTRDFHLARLSLTGGPDPVDFLDNFTTGHPNNYAGFSDPAFDSAVRAIHAAADRRARFGLMQDAHRILCGKLPAIPVYSSSQAHLVREPLKPRFHPDLDGIFSMGDL
jgi:oligopeptide transport system substrate-binding protein